MTDTIKLLGKLRKLAGAYGAEFQFTSTTAAIFLPEKAARFIQYAVEEDLYWLGVDSELSKDGMSYGIKLESH